MCIRDRAVGGDRAKVDLLLPPGVEYHSWEPKASDVVKIAAADVIIYLGSSLEPHVNDLMKGAAKADILVMAASQDLPILLAEEGSKEETHARGHDPHIWQDLELSQRIVRRIAEVFSKRDPGGASTYLRNAETYSAQLAALDQQYREGLRRCRHRTFLFGGHAAFSYLARRYGLEQMALYSVNPDSKPTAKQLTAVVDLAKQRGISVVFYETLVSDELARVIAKEVGGKTLLLNPGGNVTREDWEKGVSLISLMEANLRNLREGLGCE